MKFNIHPNTNGGIPSHHHSLIILCLLPLSLFEGTFSVTLYRPVDFEKWVDGWAEKLSENRISILRLIRHNPMISKKEMQNTIGISTTSIDNHISFLKRTGLLSRSGGAKGGHWNIHYNQADNGQQGG